MSIAKGPYTYTGEAIEPEVQVQADFNDGVPIDLEENKDFTVTYRNNVNAGTAAIVIEGISEQGSGAWWGTCEKTFDIDTASLDDATLTLKSATLTYSGKKLTPTIQSVTTKGGQTLSAKTDYTVAYSASPKAIGTYTVTVQGKGNYTGTSAKASFTIVPKGTTISKLTAASKAFTASWKKQTDQTTGYQMQYSVAKSFKGAKTVKTK